MKYITIKRYKRNNLNIPYGTEIEEINNILYYNDQRICNNNSAVMRDYFARNDDSKGLERGKISHSIIKTLLIQKNETKEHWQQRWDIVWKDPICNKYKKDKDSTTTFLWSIDFYNAPLFDLYYIAKLVKAPIGGQINV